jgi:predicted DNA-binding WGR domain protein
MAYLTRTDPNRNINRFYIVQVTPTLFGHARVRPGAARQEPCGMTHMERHDDAQAAERRSIKRRLRHGYPAI